MQVKMQDFLNQPWWQMRALLILLFGKTKALFGKDAARKRTVFLQYYVICGKRKRNQRTKIGGIFFYEVESHMQKLSSFGRKNNTA